MVLTDAEAGDGARRAKEEEKGDKIATVAVLRCGMIAMKKAAAIKIRNSLILAKPDVAQSTICRVWGTAAANL
jgi:hypothetical protein